MTHDAYADLEIGLHRRDAAHYTVELRFTPPQSDADMRLSRDGPTLVTFDQAQLRSLAVDLHAYGQALSAHLFANADIKTKFVQVMSAAQAAEVPLRLRLIIGPSAPELHALRWETLCHPDDGSLLLTNARILFSRYLSSFDWRPVHPHTQRDLRALVLIANPTNLDEYQSGGMSLAPIDVAGELARARASLGTLPITALTEPGTATLSNLVTQLWQGYDILYLVAHGALLAGKPWLCLEDDQGCADVVAGHDLVTRLQELTRLPRLVVLASCESATSETPPPQTDDGALAALGPRMAEIGIPAVLAMQGRISMQTIEQCLPVFFSQLQQHGEIDRALTQARGLVRERPDWWMPVLFLRLKSGRLWYAPGFAETDRERGRATQKWNALLTSIRNAKCLPILGPDLAEWLTGSSRDIAYRLAETSEFPLSPFERDSLPQVTKYIAVVNDLEFVPHAVMQHLCREIERRHPDRLPALPDAVALGQCSSAEVHQQLETMLHHVWQQQTHHLAEPYRVLADLPFPIYITAERSNLLTTALHAAGKVPQVVLCPWNDYTRQRLALEETGIDHVPSVKRPLVYYLFGRFQEPDSLVLTEDDYFDYLIGVTEHKKLIPPQIRSLLTNSALFFLGFRMDDWEFRTLFRSLMQQHGSGRRRRHAHIAAQVTPEEDRTLAPQRARDYLEQYFQGADITIYWGSVADCMDDLHRRWEGR